MADLAEIPHSSLTDAARLIDDAARAVALRHARQVGRDEPRLCRRLIDVLAALDDAAAALRAYERGEAVES